MQHNKLWLGVGGLVTVGLVVTVLQISACTQQMDAKIETHPAEVESLGDEGLHRLTLSQKAAERLDIQTAEVREMLAPKDGEQRKVVPYASILYGAHGDTWVYTSPASLKFIRQRILIDYIDGDLAYLTDGPSTGTQVVTVGVAELFGTEFEIGH